jgi:poly-gamma-glutamate capsule biosynthesis protein CapA/YwtB (metallophosphatase superfamily)
LGYNNFPPRSSAAGSDTPGIAWLVEEDMTADIKAARTVHGADLVIPFLHWGIEETPRPTDSQRQLARRLIDAGADAIVGAHPHVTQTIEWYRGRPIIYSLGNCVFDYFPKDPPIWTGWVAELTFGKAAGTELTCHTIELDPAGIPHVVSKPVTEARPSERHR